MQDDDNGVEEAELLWDWSVSIYHELSSIARDIAAPDKWLLSEEYGDHVEGESEIERARSSVHGLIQSVNNWWSMLLELPRHPQIVDVQAVVLEVRRSLDSCPDESSVNAVRDALKSVSDDLGIQLRLAAGRVYASWGVPPHQRPVTTDGPMGKDRFRWHGRECEGLQPVPWRLLQHDWNSHERRASFDGLAEAVWLDREKDFVGSPLKQAAQSVRNFFRKNSIPLTCNASERWRTVSIAPLPVCKNKP